MHYLIVPVIITLTLLIAYSIYQPLPLPPILCINLPERQDRRTSLLKEFALWPARVEIVSAIRKKPGWKGCTLSHLKCIEIAKQRKYPWVICVEDDCQLQPGALKSLQSVLPYLWNNRGKWDIFSGGISMLKKEGAPINKDLQLIEANGYAAHFMLIHAGTYDKILNNIPKDDEHIKIIDVFYSENLRMWTRVPYLSIQRPSASDIENKNVNYNKHFQKSEQTLLKSLVQ